MNKFCALIVLVAISACEGPGEYSEPIAGPRTKNSDVFAKAFLDQMQARSFEDNREYCGLFGRDAEGYVIATAPVVGMRDTCQIPDTEEEFKAFASYHSHGAYDYGADSEVPTSNDLLADQDEGVIGYISTPGGRVWRTNYGVAVQICGRGCIAVDPDFVPRDFGPVRTRYTIAQLYRRERE